MAFDDSTCIYCGSRSYGKVCLFSPTQTHVHFDNPKKCIYCGSPYTGTGCPYNPYGKIHVRGPEFLNRSAIKTEKAAVLSYVLNIASSFLTECETFSSPLDRLYTRIAGMISSIAEPLLEAFSFRETPTYGDLTKDQLIKAVELKKKISSNLKDFNETLFMASLSLPQEIVEKTLIDAITDIDVYKTKDK